MHRDRGTTDAIRAPRPCNTTSRNTGSEDRRQSSRQSGEQEYADACTDAGADTCTDASTNGCTSADTNADTNADTSTDTSASASAHINTCTYSYANTYTDTRANTHPRANASARARVNANTNARTCRSIRHHSRSGADRYPHTGSIGPADRRTDRRTDHANYPRRVRRPRRPPCIRRRDCPHRSRPRS